MKSYNNMISRLTFREDFCEDTLNKVAEKRKEKKPHFRWATIAACFCLCTVLLLGTALAVSPALRAMLIPNSLVGTTEQPQFPETPNTQVENAMDGITARYYKLDGESAAYEGFGSVYPVIKNGTLSFYTLTEQGDLVKAKSPHHIQRDITYKGTTWSLDLDLYNGDIPVIHEGELKYPIEGNSIVLGRQEGNLWLPIFVDLTTFAIEDPAENLSFVPEEDAIKTYVQGEPGSSTLLIRSELSEDRERYYYGNGKTGQVTLLGESSFGQWTLYGGKIYSYNGKILAQVTEDGSLLPLFEGKSCFYDAAGFAYRFEGSDLHVIDLDNQREYLLANCADIFPVPIFTHNRAGTKFCISNDEFADGLYSSAIAIVDRESGSMVTLNRNSAMKEGLIGWFDHDHFLIAGTIENEWYLCLYEIPNK